MNNQLSLDGQVAVVTGGGGGIGRGICQQLARAGANVVITYNSRPDKAEATRQMLDGDGHLTMRVATDDASSVAEMAQVVHDRFGTVDILVNNAGMTRFVEHDDLDGLDDMLIDQIFRVNWRGSFACIRSLKQLLKHGNGGLVVNISSTAGISAIGSNVAYCASKAALDSMTRSLARALAPQIRVNSVAPGLVDGEYAQSFDPAWRQAQIDRAPSGRLSQPEDVGKAVLALATLLPQTTGAILTVEGGRLLN